MAVKTNEQEFHFRDCILTMDACHWFSPGYRGMSSRSELWLVALLYAVLCLWPGVWLGEYYPLTRDVIGMAVHVLIFFPLYIRRGRQMGSIAYGLTPIVAYLWPLLAALESYFTYGWNAVDEVLSGFPYVLYFITLLPLFFYGGSFSGRKNELHRAALAGDRARAERLLAYFPSGLTKKSEKGYTPSDYAQKAGHDELAAWFRAREEERMTAKTAAL